MDRAERRAVLREWAQRRFPREVVRRRQATQRGWLRLVHQLDRITRQAYVKR